MKAIAMMAAQISAKGMPLNAFGALLDSSLTLMQANRKIVMKNPTEVPKALESDSKKPRPASVFSVTTPKTAQLVVISGR